MPNSPLCKRYVPYKNAECRIYTSPLPSLTLSLISLNGGRAARRLVEDRLQGLKIYLFFRKYPAETLAKNAAFVQ